MPGYDDIASRKAELEKSLADIINPEKKDTEQVCPIPPESDEYVAQYIVDLYLDSLNFKRAYFQSTDHMRPIRPTNAKFGYDEWRKACETLASSARRNFDVWGKRAEDWMAQRVDGEIPRSMHVRKDHITANWHEIEVNPNIKHIGDIYDQERKNMGWKDWIEEYVGLAQVYGTSINEITVDYTLHPDGQIKNVARMIDQVMRTPESKSFSKSDGCTYAVVLETINDKQIKEQFADLDLTMLKTSSEIEEEQYKKRNSTKSDYKHTKFYPKLRAFIDDQTIEPIPFDEQQQIEMADEMSRMLDGEIIPARPDQNHIEHLKAKLGAVDNLLSVQPETDEDLQLGTSIAAAHLTNADEHAQYAMKEDLAARGLRFKYPHGRYVCVIGGKVVHDMPNPYDVPWRLLFREVQNQRVISRIDGEGDPEIMMNEAYQADMQLSRIEDLSILQMPQVYRPLADKEIPGEDVNDNNPRRVRYTTGTVTVVQGQPPTTQLELYKISKENAQRDRGVNDISFGNSQPSGTSGRLAALLQAQNQTVITGELDRNMREALEDIVEGNFEVMKVIYNQDREYILNGQVVTLNVAELLKTYSVKDPSTGQEIQKPLPKIQVTVKPGSNYPNQWERRLAFLVDMSQTKDETGLPIVPSAALYDQLAIQYPEFAEGGKYRHMNEATAIGLQILQQEQAVREQQAKEQNAITSASQKFDKETLKPQFEKLTTGAGNGQGH